MPAKDSLSALNKMKTKYPQAKLNNMKKVTPGSIVYAALMVCAHHISYTLLTLATAFSTQFHHCISVLDDWCTEDDLFDSLFAQSLLDLLEDPDNTWTQDTLAWWNK